MAESGASQGREPAKAVHGKDISTAVWLNGGMASFIDSATGRSDLEPFWPSRQAHAYDRLCCRAH